MTEPDGPPQQEEPAPGPVRWLVDGFNVLHAGVLRGRERGRWWGDEARERLLERAACFVPDASGANGDDGAGAEVWVVFDGPRPRAEAGGHASLRVVFADSADDWLLDQVRHSPEPERLAVVTADRRLADRSRHRGAHVMSPAAFLARCATRHTARTGGGSHPG